MEIVILDRQSDKLIRMEVHPKHTIGSIIETIVDRQKLEKNRKYRLSLGNQSFGKEDYLLKVKDTVIRHADHLFLEPEIAAAATQMDTASTTRKFEEKRISEANAVQRIPKFCGQCGKPLRPNAKFCLNCGAPAKIRPAVNVG